MARSWQEVDAEDILPATRCGPIIDPAPAYRTTATPAAQGLDWRKRMSDTIAYALLVYTALQIFVTMRALDTAGGSLLPYLALIILVAAIIPSCRRFERRWNRLDDAQAGDSTLAHSFHRDQIIVWALAIGLPFVITGAFWLLGATFR